MSEKQPAPQELNREDLLEEFSIMELEQRLEFEAWCDSNTNCPECTPIIIAPAPDPGPGPGILVAAE